MTDPKAFLIPQKVADYIAKHGFVYPGFSIKTENLLVSTKDTFLFRCALAELAATADSHWLCTQLGLRTDAEFAVTIPKGDPMGQPDVHLMYGRATDEHLVHFVVDDNEKGAPFLEDYPTVDETARKVVAYFASYTGMRTCIHFMRNPSYEPPPEYRASYDLNIVFGSSPPGDIAILELQYYCGVQLHHQRYWRRMSGPTAGRGTVLSTPDGDFGQISDDDNIVWIFAPRIETETLSLFTEKGQQLFHKLMRNVAQALAEGVEHAPEHTIESIEDFAAFGKLRYEENLKYCESEIKKAEAKAKEALASYQNALADHRGLLLMRSVLQTQTDESSQRISDAFAHIRGRPQTRRILDVDGAVHIETNRMISEIDGHRYDCGRLMIRIPIGGKISIWSIEPTHPKGIAHPHISADGAICFGNVGPAIAESINNDHIDDAVDLIYDWLEHGYDETLAAIKITEWPEITEIHHVTKSKKTKSAQSRTSAKAL